MLSSVRTPSTAADENSLVARSGGAALLLPAAKKAATAATRGGAGMASPAADPTRISKTPRTHGMKTRRALGDISNRKAGSSSANDSTAASAATATKDHGSRRRSTVLKKPVFALSTAAPVKNSPVVVAAKKAVSFAMDVEPEDFALDGTDRIRPLKAPSTPHTAKLRRPSHHQDDDERHPLMEFDFDEDIEMPAGRLWVDQPWLDDDDALSLELSLEGAATAREDLLEDLERRHRLRLERSRLDDENALRAVDEDVEKLLRSDELLRFTPPSPASSIDSFSNADLAGVWCSQQDDDDESIGDPLDVSF